MTDNIKAFDIGGVKGKLDSTTRILKLGQVATTAGDITLHNQADNTNYQVPTGKKARIMYIVTFNDSDATGKIFYADNADGNTNAVNLYVPANSNTTADTIFVSAEVPAGKYINRTATGVWDAAPQVYILEEDA